VREEARIQKKMKRRSQKMLRTKNILNQVMGSSLLASMGFAAFLLVSAPALAATAPSLGSDSIYAVVSSTFTNTAIGTTITGDVCYTTGPAVTPNILGTTSVPCASSTGTDETTALGVLNGEACTPLGAAVALDTVTIGLNPAGTFPPGCYSSTGAMSINTGKTVTLSGTGVYIFRSVGALSTAASSNVVVTNGACESDVYWAPTATTLGANSTFVGNILDDNAITMEANSSLTGRALDSATTVTLNGANTITIPTCVPVPPPGGVTLGKVFTPVTNTPGGVSTLTITLSNNNDNTATLNTDLTDNLPSGVTTVGVPTTTCGVETPTATSSSVTLPTGATIPAGTPGTCTVTVDVTASATGSFINTLNIGALSVNITGGGTASNTASALAPFTAVPPASVPTLNEWGVIIFMVFAGLGSVYYLRKYRRV